jgi:hypothetical protein
MCHVYKFNIILIRGKINDFMFRFYLDKTSQGKNSILTTLILGMTDNVGRERLGRQSACDNVSLSRNVVREGKVLEMFVNRCCYKLNVSPNTSLSMSTKLMLNMSSGKCRIDKY